MTIPEIKVIPKEELCPFFSCGCPPQLLLFPVRTTSSSTVDRHKHRSLCCPPLVKLFLVQTISVNVSDSHSCSFLKDRPRFSLLANENAQSVCSLCWLICLDSLSSAEAVRDELMRLQLMVVFIMNEPDLFLDSLMSSAEAVRSRCGSSWMRRL